MSDVKEKTASDHRQLWWIPLLCLLVGGALLGIATNLAKFAVEIGLTPLAFLFWSISARGLVHLGHWAAGSARLGSASGVKSLTAIQKQ